ncbi:hypothetical protein ACQKNB_15775 [Lysinibacillus xylanilyticus]|uniref:hypothetical protein n=1 Tax=Lysinibacillus xylanilyticus TaxID=582475 RepID=UPI003D01D595
MEKERFSPSIILAFKLAKLFNCQIENIFIWKRRNKSWNRIFDKQGPPKMEVPRLILFFICK